MSVLLFHPSVAPFVQQAGRALHEAGWLARFITTIHSDPASRFQRTAGKLARAVGIDFAARLKQRTITEIPQTLVESHPWGELARLVSGRLDPSGRLGDIAWERTELAFDRRVARRLTSDIRGVYGYEHSSRATFAAARRRALKIFYDVPAPEPGFVHSLLAAEIEKFPELSTLYHRHTSAREKRRLERRKAEWDAADLVIAASRFTRDSFRHAGRDVNKVRIVPYGAPPPIDRDQALGGGSEKNAPLTLLWSGTFSIRKGAHYLLAAWRAANFGRHARLRVFGTQALPERLLTPLPFGIDFAGPISRDQLMDHYRTSDALIFPTLCDGFGMVATEAWSRGLPVITTDRAGAADLLRPGENGLLIPAASAEAITHAIAWCLEHRAELRAWREIALATAASWQWSDYRSALRDALTPELAS